MAELVDALDSKSSF